MLKLISRKFLTSIIQLHHDLFPFAIRNASLQRTFMKNAMRNVNTMAKINSWPFLTR